MTETLASYAIKMISSEIALKAELDVPLLLWVHTGTGDVDPDRIYQTHGGAALDRPREGEPLVYQLRKGNAKMNAFAMGITLGRNDNNDLIVDDPSISRFHAYFQQDVRGAWKLVDAESRNGTWLGPLKVKANESAELPDGALLRFGDVRMKFFLPASFLTFLARQMESSGPVRLM